MWLREEILCVKLESILLNINYQIYQNIIISTKKPFLVYIICCLINEIIIPLQEKDIVCKFLVLIIVFFAVEESVSKVYFLGYKELN